MALVASARISVWLGFAALALGQGQHCYYGPSRKFQAPADLNLVPCLETGYSTCCFAGDICLAGGACYNYDRDDTYQYGCTDESYQDPSCPFKCGWSPDHSPWVALENCESDGYDNTWVCHSPESCGCEWRSTYELLVLPPRGCDAMGSLARVAIYGPTQLEAYASLPSSVGGSTGYYSASVSTPVTGYTPASVGPTTTYSMPTVVIQLNKDATPSPSFGTATFPNGSLPPIPTTGVLAESSSYPPEVLAGVTSGLTNTGGNPTGSGSGANGASTGGADSGSNGDGSGGGLTTGAKVGLGVGIAGGVCLLAAIILTAVVLRKRKQLSKNTGQDPGIVERYDDKSHDSYQSYTSAAPVAYFDPHRDSPSPGLYEAPGTPQDEEIVKKRLSPQGPQELGGSQLHEMESNTGTPTSTPALSPVIGSHSRSASGVQ